MSQEDEIAFMSTNLNDDDIDLSMRAPYIPMNESDDLPLLTEDLMWSAFSDEMSLHKTIKDTQMMHNSAVTIAQYAEPTTNRKSSLAALLSSQPSNGSFKELQKQFTSSHSQRKTASNPTSNSYGNDNGHNRGPLGTLHSNNNHNAFNQNHNTQPNDDDSAESGAIDHQRSGAGSITSNPVDQFDDDAFPKNCKFLLLLRWERKVCMHLYIINNDSIYSLFGNCKI